MVRIVRCFRLGHCARITDAFPEIAASGARVARAIGAVRGSESCDALGIEAFHIPLCAPSGFVGWFDESVAWKGRI